MVAMFAWWWSRKFDDVNGNIEVSDVVMGEEDDFRGSGRNMKIY